MAKTEQSSPPAGNGQAPGLGEAFSINLSTGQGTYSYQIPLPEGVAGHTPRLALQYAHGNGHDAWGLGWRFPLRGIARRLDFGTPGTPDEGLVAERFVDGDAEIVPLADGSFRALREAAFSRYTRSGDGWRIEERDGQVHELGLTAAARVAPPDRPEDAGRVVEWLVERTLDVSGNAIQHTYRMDQGIAYPAAIRYAVYEVRFTYEERPDARHDGRAGFSRRRALRCSRIALVLDPGDPGGGERTLRTYDFVYTTAPGSGVSLLAEIRLTAKGAAADGSADVHRPTIRFTYSGFDPRQLRARWMANEGAPPPGLDDPDAALVTLDDAPLPGILSHRNGREVYWANRGEGRWAPPRPLPAAPLASSLRSAGLAFVDMDGSGTADLMVADPGAVQGYYENGGSAGWAGFVPFPRGRGATPAWSTPGLRLSDVDADGLIDALASERRGFVYWRNGGREGWSDPVLVPRGGDMADVDLADPDVHLADMTGDGAADLVRVRSGRVEVWPGLGHGRFGARTVMGNSPRLRRDALDELLLVDLDGDGCTDLVQVSARGVTVYQNRNGQSFAEPVVLDAIPAPIPGTVRPLSLRGGAGAGLLWNSRTAGGPRYVQLEPTTEPPYLLSRVDNGAGLTSEISYRSAVEDYERDRRAGVRWTTHFPFPYLVVAGTRETDAVSGRATVVEILYHEAHFERATRQFQGFRRTERIEKGDDSRPDTRFVHTFLMAQERAPGNGPEHAALNGLLSRVETYQLDGSAVEGLPYVVETSEHGLTVLDTVLDEGTDGRARSFVFVTVHRQEDSERTGDSRIEEKSYAYDGNGNVVRETRRGSGAVGGAARPTRELVTEIAYAASGRHLLGKPSRVIVRDQDGTLLSEKRLYYDGPDFAGLPLGQADRGLLVREEEWVLTRADFDDHYAGMDAGELGYVFAANADGIASVFATTRRQRHDARGLLLALRDPLGTETRVVYDADGLFRQQLSDPLGDTLFEHDRATGQIVRVTHPDGGVVRFSYDAQGRILRSALPGEDLDAAAAVYEYDETAVPNRRRVRFRQADGTTTLGVTYFDGAGKDFQQRVEVGPDRFLVSGLKLTNPWGDLRLELEPTFADTADFALPESAVLAGLPSRRFVYDARGRAVRTVNYNLGVSTAEYLPFGVVLRDANDNDGSAASRARGQFDTPREEETDVFRYLVRVTDRLGAGAEATTRYEVGPQGELASVADGRGVKLRYRYDRRGSRLAIVLRESGERKIWYDARKKPVRTLDPAGHDLRATWDALGRQTRLASGAGLLEEYTYDVAGRQAVGRLAEVSYPGGRQTFTYDAAGRLRERDWRFDGEAAPHSLRYEYDPLGRETAAIHTDGTRVERRLTANGWLRGVPGVVDEIDHDPRGFPASILYANGVRTRFDYTPGPGRIRRQTTTSPQGDVLSQVDFTFDAMEVLLSRDDGAPGGAGRRDFSYDPLYQLTAVAGVEGGHPVERRYDYAADYNLRRFDEAGVTLHYDDSAHPDRLSGLTPDGGALFPVAYDGNGNLLGLPGQQLEYNAKNELTRLTRGDGLTAEYRYDHLGARVSKALDDRHGNTARILYIGERAEIRDGRPAYFVAVGGLRVAVLAGGAVRFLHDDGLGSTRLVTDAAGRPIGDVDCQPFGNPAARSGEIDFRTFSRRPVDEESGLVYMLRRYYAPQLGRFLTPDLMAIYQPEKLLHTPQALHLYAFAANDPLNKTDPTGLSFWSVVGAIAGVAAGIAVGVAIVAAVVATGGIAGVLIGIGLTALASLSIVGISYLAASNTDPNGAFGQFMRGFMIGFNAGMNGVLATAIFGPGIGGAVGIIGVLAAFDGVSWNPTYQGVLGWSSWLMPMSWGATGLGLGAFLINLVAAKISGEGNTKIDKLAIDWKTGSIVMEGGWIRNGTAFNLGNFIYIDTRYVVAGDPERSYEALVRHETGHTLNVGAFGSAFHFYDFLGENVFGRGRDDYGEKLAESHSNRPGDPVFPMWG
jgi:RHS repeat-associated protein